MRMLSLDYKHAHTQKNSEINSALKLLAKQASFSFFSKYVIYFNGIGLTFCKYYLPNYAFYRNIFSFKM